MAEWLAHFMFGASLVQILAWRLSTLTDVSCDFPQSLQASASNNIP
jgi:hypothetical protein